MLTGYYKKNKGKLSKKACKRYQNLSEEKKCQYPGERYQMKKKIRRSVNIALINIKN